MDSPPNSSEVKDIELKANSKQLVNFISSLMGEKRSSGKIFDCYFSIDLNWIIAFASLVSQRIKAQNDGEIVNFQLILRYDNNDEKTITSIETLQAFHDLSKAVSIGFSLKMIYAIRFPYKADPDFAGNLPHRKNSTSFYDAS